MTREQYVVGPSEGAWELTRDRERLALYSTQKDGIDAAVRICRYRLSEIGKLAELTIKRPNGKIRDKRTYGRDPRETKG